MRHIAVRGVRYQVEIRGTGPTLLFLHGFTGTAAGWAGVVEELPPGLRTVCIDLLGHGGTDAPLDPARYSMTESAWDVIALAEVLQLGRFHLVGYSMGGRLALHVALARPELLSSLVLMSASPGIADPVARRERRARDAELAQFILKEGVPAFVSRWEELPLFATEKRLPPDVREAVRGERLGQNPHGLANSLLGAGAGTQEYLLERLRELRIPTLLVAGALDDKYVQLAHAMADVLPAARVEVLADAGHAVHRERPQAVAHVPTEHLRDMEAIM